MNGRAGCEDRLDFGHLCMLQARTTTLSCRRPTPQKEPIERVLSMLLMI